MDWQVRRFGELDSTNTWLLDEARRGAPAGLIAVAHHQTAGRGRLGRTWEAPPGANLLVSVLLEPDLPVDRLHLVTAAVALAAAEACEVVAGVRPELKWPNDLLVGDAKLAGILAESALPKVVVGLGLNVGWAPPGAISLAEAAEAAGASSASRAGADAGDTGVRATPAVALEALLDGLGRRLDDWDAVALEHRQRCATVGRRVRVELAGETFVGTALDVTPDGHLLVEPEGAAPGSLRTVTAGDVVHLRPVAPHP